MVWKPCLSYSAMAAAFAASTSSSASLCWLEQIVTSHQSPDWLDSRRTGRDHMPTKCSRQQVLGVALPPVQRQPSQTACTSQGCGASLTCEQAPRRGPVSAARLRPPKRCRRPQAAQSQREPPAHEQLAAAARPAGQRWTTLLHTRVPGQQGPLHPRSAQGEQQGLAWPDTVLEQQHRAAASGERSCSEHGAACDSSAPSLCARLLLSRAQTQHAQGN